MDMVAFGVSVVIAALLWQWRKQIKLHQEALLSIAVVAILLAPIDLLEQHNIRIFLLLALVALIVEIRDRTK
jgi:hypothetical protein